MTEDKQTRLSAKQVQTDLTEKLDKVVESTNSALKSQGEAIDATSAQVTGLDEKIDKVLTALNNPAIIRKHFEPLEQDLGGGTTAEDNGDSIVLPSNANPDSMEFQNKAEALAFMEEPVTIWVHDTSEQNAATCFDVSVNGEKCIFIRNTHPTVKRKFVEGLARAKPIHFSNQEYIKPDGEKGVKWPTRSGLRFGFSVEHDPNPKGLAWLKGLLAEA